METGGRGRGQGGTRIRLVRNRNETDGGTVKVVEEGVEDVGR